MGFLKNPVKSISGTLSQASNALAASPLVKSVESAAAATVSAVAGTFGIPITPSQVNQLATGVKTSVASAAGKTPTPIAVNAAPPAPNTAPPSPVANAGLMSTGGSNSWMIAGAVVMGAVVLWRAAS